MSEISDGMLELVHDVTNAAYGWACALEWGSGVNSAKKAAENTETALVKAIAELEAEVAKAKAENSKWFDCYCEFETIAPDGKLKISVLELYNRLKELDAEVAALKEYRDGHDPKTDFPPEGVWVNMRDGCDDMFPVQYDPEMHWYWNLSGDDGGMEYWNLDDSCLVRWYPVPPLPELPEVSNELS